MQKPALAAMAIFAFTTIFPAYGGLNPSPSAPLSEDSESPCLSGWHEMEWQLAGLAAEGAAIEVDAEAAALFDAQITVEPAVPEAAHEMQFAASACAGTSF